MNHLKPFQYYLNSPQPEAIRPIILNAPYNLPYVNCTKREKASKCTVTDYISCSKGLILSFPILED
jgi:hypothetical protein